MSSRGDPDLEKMIRQRVNLDPTARGSGLVGGAIVQMRRFLTGKQELFGAKFFGWKLLVVVVGWNMTNEVFLRFLRLFGRGWELGIFLLVAAIALPIWAWGKMTLRLGLIRVLAIYASLMIAIGPVGQLLKQLGYPGYELPGGLVLPSRLFLAAALGWGVFLAFPYIRGAVGRLLEVEARVARQYTCMAMLLIAVVCYFLPFLPIYGLLLGQFLGKAGELTVAAMAFVGLWFWSGEE